jgi:hypothetical protein
MFAALVSLPIALALAADTQRDTPKRVLVYTVSAGYEHAVVHRPQPNEPSLVERVLERRARESRWFDVVLSRDAHDFTRANLATFDAVLFYTTGDLPFSADEQRALFDFVKKGGGFVGVHSATDTFPSVPEYAELVGARFDGHPWHELVGVRVADTSSPATRHLGASFQILDEIYQFGAPYDRANLHVLLELETTPELLARPGVNRTDGDFALAWCKDAGAGRVFYTALGHRAEVWEDERFLRHLEGGIAWAARAEPRVALAPELETYRKFARDNAGDPARGYALFRQETGPMCVRCHSVFGDGGRVGPELSDAGAKYNTDELAIALLAPSERIAEGFAAVTLELTSGDVVFGQIASEDVAALVLYDTNGTQRRIARSDIVRREASRTSLMPEGLPALVGREAFADLVAYLRTLRGAPK